MILHRNLAIGGGEADLVTLDPDGRTVVLVEVKTRAASALPPEESVDHRKRRRLRRVADWLQRDGRYPDAPIRFDIVAIVWLEGGRPEVRHYVDAFDDMS